MVMADSVIIMVFSTRECGYRISLMDMIVFKIIPMEADTLVNLIME